MKLIETQIAYATIGEISEQLRSRQLSPVELTMSMLARIERLNPRLNAFVTVTAELAIQQARQAERELLEGIDKGPLHGIPIVHKDLYYTKGIRTTCSSKILKDFVPEHDATAVEKLREAGTILLGKVQTHEFAAGATTSSPHFGPCRNPWNLDKVPGGSSGGSGSAVAAGLAFMGTGTDTGGSIRIPAACCGVVGMKPTYGRVSRYGIFPLAWSLDHAGPLTRSVKDAALCLQAMAGYDPKDESTANISVPDFTVSFRSDLKGTRLGIPAEYFFEGLAPEVELAVRKAIADLESLGAEVVPVSIPMSRYVFAAEMAVATAEAFAIHERWSDTVPDDYGPDVRGLLESGRTVTAAQYLQAQRARHVITSGFVEALGNVDALVMPALPITAPDIAAADTEGMKLAQLVSPFNITGLPSLVLPCGISPDGMPISLQIVGRPFDEAGVLGIGYAYEQATPWHTRRPEFDSAVV